MVEKLDLAHARARVRNPLDRVLGKGGFSAFRSLNARAGWSRDANLNAGSSGRETCARVDLIHLAHVRSNPLTRSTGHLAVGAVWLFSAHALVAIHTQEFCRFQLVGDHFAGGNRMSAVLEPTCPVSALIRTCSLGHALFSANLRLVGTRSPHRRCPQKWGCYLSPLHQTLSNQAAGTLGAPSATLRNARFQFHSDHSPASS